MDDDESILKLTEKMLRTLGFQVDLVRNGEEAIEKYKASYQEEKYILVIMDLTVPGKMGGKESAEELLKINPDIKIIISSGYSADAALADYKSLGFSGILTKPFDIKEISTEIHRVIS